MMRLLSLLLLSLPLVSASSHRAAFTRGLSSGQLFGLRGGGLFGKGDDKSPSDKAQDTTTTEFSESSKPTESIIPTEKKIYPAMTQQEIEDWMDHVPVYAVTDMNGAGVVVRPADGNETNIFYFFMNPQAANATMEQLKSSNSNLNLKVTAFSLGKIWFRLLNPEEKQDVKIKFMTGDQGTTSNAGVEYRLVPDTRDLLGARMLLTMTPEDTEKLKNGELMSSEMAQKALERAIADTPKFKATFNEIPLFTIAQMRMQRKGEEGKPANTLLPMYFSLQNMIGTWQLFMENAGPDVQGVEPSINLMALSDLVEMMRNESEINFRDVVLVPPAPENAKEQKKPSGPSTSDPMAGMGGATLGDI